VSRQENFSTRKLRFLPSKHDHYGSNESHRNLVRIPKSWVDATAKGIEKASKSLKGIKSAWVQSQSVTIDDKGQVSDYRVTLKPSFEVM
jgi:flavin-binding protein dodecin